METPSAARKSPLQMKKKIVSFGQDEEGDWRALLECSHYQHVRHDPPLISREWVKTEDGRRSRIGSELECRKCDEGAEADY